MTMYRQSWDAVGSPGMTVGFVEQPGSELCGQNHTNMRAKGICG